MKRDSKKIIIITGGEPAGIGSEIITKTLKNFKSKNRIIIIGEKGAFTPFTDKLNIISGVEDYKEGYLNLINTDYVKKVSFGKPDENTALSAIRSLELAIEIAKELKKVALVTAPIYKEGIIKLPQYKDFIGHTEFLGKSFNSKVLMMFYGKKLKVGTLTTHIPLKDVPNSIKTKNIEESVKIANHYLKKYFSLETPKIVVLGLNPHAGEGGKIGEEEIHIIKPAIKNLKKEGINVEGPVSADIVLYYALKGDYDFVFGLYHDQVLPTFKTLYFDSGVNITLGLPIIRTSPDHGTAFDIAGRGIASEKSFKNALSIAIRLLNKGK